MIEIENDSGNTVFNLDIGALAGTATQYSIPGYTFAPGRSYKATLRFLKTTPVDVSSVYNGVSAGTAHYSQTRFPLVTTGTPIQPRLEVVSLNGGQFQFVVKGESNMQYTVQGSSVLMNDWNNMGTSYATDIVATNAFMGSFFYSDPNVQINARKFFRAAEGSGNQGSPQ